MIVYFANRKMEILGQASTGLPRGFIASDDKKIEDVETGVASFECTVSFEMEDRLQLQEIIKAGNYILRSNGDENEFYTIIDSELDVNEQEINLYAEDAGLDLLNDIAQAFEATEAHPIKWYVEKWTNDSGFEIGINEIPDLTRKLKWEGETTVTERLASVATQFDNAEISYTFDIDRFSVIHKYINIHKKRGKDTGEVFRINKNLNNIVIKSSVANLATALYVTGGTPEGKEGAITLAGYKYDDGDFYVSGSYLKSRKAVKKWSRFLSESGSGEGHIEKTYKFDTTSQQELCAHAVTELKKICDTEVNYEVDIAELPLTVKIGDTINLVDDCGELYLSARVLKLERSIANKTQKATLGDYLIKPGGISDKVQELASQFAELAKNRVFYTWIVYADDENGNGISLDPTDKRYIGISTNKSTIDPDLTDPTVYKWSQIEGKDGRSLEGIIEHYLASPESTGITIQTTGWTTSIPVMDEVNKYLWNYETFVYSNGDEEDNDPRIIGIRGENGDSAPSIVSMTQQYFLSDSKIEVAGASEWSRNLPEYQSGKYLWTRWATRWSVANPTEITYSDPVLSVTWNEIHETADSAKTNADAAKNAADTATAEVSRIDGELASANAEIAELTQNLETVSSEMAANYAKKTELTSIESDLGTKIDQNAASISSMAKQVTTIQTNASQALIDAAAAQNAANAAKQNAIDAQNKYTQLQTQADATDAQLKDAKEAVEKAQADAFTASDAAAVAQAAANSLGTRVTEAETKISQNADSILSVATKLNSRIIGGRNYLCDSFDEQESDNNRIASYELDDDWVKDGTYTLSFKGSKSGGSFAAYCDDGETLLDSNIQYNEVGGTYECTFVCSDPVSVEDDQKPILTIYLLPRDTVYSGFVKEAKLEKGNVVTDWSPATSDTNDYASQLIEESKTSIKQTADDIVSEALKSYVTASELETTTQELSSKISQSSSSVSIEFTNITSRVNGIESEINKQNKFIRLKDGNVIIGNSESPIQAKFTNDSLQFLYSDQTVAKFTNEVLEVQNISVQNQVRFGEEWAIRPGNHIAGKGSNLDDVWIGG